jgi:chloride channel 3/4/5
MVSRWVADAFGKASIYDTVIERNGFPYLNNKMEYTYAGDISDIIDKCGAVINVQQRNTVGRLQDKLNNLGMRPNTSKAKKMLIQASR